MCMVLPFEYWPSLTWVANLINAPDIQLEQWGTYQKQSLVNRCKITGGNGTITLSVPLIGGREQKALLTAVEIDYSQHWPLKHLRSVKSCYGKAPFFDHYFPLIEQLLMQHFPRLMDLDFAIILQLQKWLKWKQEIHLTDNFRLAAAQPVLQPLPIQKLYLQVFSHKYPFVPNLSILDALFCLGPGINEYLKT